MESGLENSYFPVFRGGVNMDKWTPGGLQVDSRWILDKELAGLTPKKKGQKSTWTPGIHMESTWNLWLRVKSSCVGEQFVHCISFCLVLWQLFFKLGVVPRES